MAPDKQRDRDDEVRDGSPAAVDTPGAVIQSEADGSVELKLTDVQQELAKCKGKGYWQSLEEITGRDGFDELMEREFPQHASEWLDPVSRRGFMKLMGASLALAGLSACTKQPWEGVVPYVKQPEDLIPGKPMYYATVMPMPTGAFPLLVKSNEFRPTKIEGNPDHPASMGTTDVWAQASILGLYDPDRSQTVTFEGSTRGWPTFLGAIRENVMAQRNSGGAGLRILTGTSISPTFSAMMKQTLALYPQAKWVQYEPANRDNIRAGLKSVFGRYVEPQYNLEAAEVIVSLDADFLSGAQFPGFTKYARQYAMKRKTVVGEWNRLYVIESTMSTTGGKAEHRLPLRASEIEHAAAYIANAMGAGVNASGGKDFTADEKKYLDAVAKDLQEHRGKAVVIPGEYQSAALHSLAAQINQAAGAIGQTVIYGDPIETDPQMQTDALKELVGEMNAGKVQMLFVLGANPVYSGPADFQMVGAFKNFLNAGGLGVHLGEFKDETSRYCQWHINEAHYLEAWGDARACDGTASIVQPLIEPLYNGKSTIDVIATLGDTPSTSAYDFVRQYWSSSGQLKGSDFEAQWRSALNSGFIPNTASTAKYTPAGAAAVTLTPVSEEMELIFRPDPSLHDGRFSNIAWLQEIAKPVSKMSWDNAILVDVRTADARKWNEGDVIEITTKAGKIELPVLKMPGHAPNAMTVYLGFGRTHSGRVGTGVGSDTYLLRTSDAPWVTTPSSLKKVNKNYAICVSRSHTYKAAPKHPGEIEQFESQEAIDRGIVRTVTIEDLMKDGDKKIREGFDEPGRGDTLYPNFDYSKENQWGMTIDATSCVGCNACVIACQSENNIATVGRFQQQIGREMLWLRIDTYYTGDVSNPRASFLPIPCMHCENAPCEPVCPVGATVHSPEGLNVMVYNRCVGTRYCSNNCPYKVRRFNFLLYSDYDTPSLKLMNNPDVTVRSRGVMEKCSYCVQRISAARITAEKEGRPVKDGDVVTACQQACPTEAISFGNINDPNSKVSHQKRDMRNYSMLASVNTRPRTSYLAGVLNPNPDLGDGPMPQVEEVDLSK